MVGLFLPLAPRVEADTDVSLNFFYDNLSPYGSWIDVDGYGYCFQPSVAVDNADWRPYADGYWAYTDVGWTWVSYEDFGWATYHYGRWTDLADYGWVWVPGYEWGPAWVSWRTGGDYVGWAPLPPVSNVIYEGRAITGQVDVLFDIGPLYYNFCDVRYIGEPVLRGRIFAPSRNVTIINQTVNVTNITYNNSMVYNYGPNYNSLNQYSARPIQRLTLQRETTSNLGQGGKRGNFNRVNGNQLTVVAPAIQKSQQQIAPKQVKAKVENPKVERGWQGVQDRAQLQDEMKKENAKNVRLPSFQPQKDRKPEVVARGQASAEVDENVGARGPRNIQQPKIDRRSGQPQKSGNPEAVTADQNGRVQPEGANEENGREQRGLQAGQQGANRSRKEREAGVKDMAADKHKNQQDAQQGWDQGGRLSNKPNGQPIRNAATQDVRNVAVKPPENFVEQPNKEARRPPQNHQTKTAPPPPQQRDGQPQHQQQEQQGKKKKKPEDKPPDR
jgi:hypothetical protein